MKRWRVQEPELWAWALADSIERANRLTGYVACQAISLLNQAEVAAIKHLYKLMTSGDKEDSVKLLEVRANAARGLLTYAGKVREQAMANAKVDAAGELRPSLSAEFVEKVRRVTPEPVLKRIVEKREETVEKVRKVRARKRAPGVKVDSSLVVGSRTLD